MFSFNVGRIFRTFIICKRWKKQDALNGVSRILGEGRRRWRFSSFGGWNLRFWVYFWEKLQLILWRYEGEDQVYQRKLCPFIWVYVILEVCKDLEREEAVWWGSSNSHPKHYKCSSLGLSQRSLNLQEHWEASWKSRFRNPEKTKDRELKKSKECLPLKEVGCF